MVPLASIHVQKILEEQFPEYKVELIDITRILIKRPGILIVNGFYTLKEYWRMLVQRKKKFKECFFSTSYIFHKIKVLMEGYLSLDDYVFSFQMQSLYDASKEGLPNFVYTDNTILANLDSSIADKSALFPDWFIELEGQIYKNARIVFVRSNNVARSLVKQYGYPQEKVKMVFAGSNVQRRYDRKFDKEYTNKNILFVGIDWYRKGGPELVDAFRRVLESHPTAQLIIVGCIPKVDVPNCTVVGKVSLERLNEYYEQASIFCLPTRMEPFGIAFLEAMEHKLPIVTTKTGAIPDFVIDGKNGYLIPIGDVHKIASAINKLLNSPEVCKEFGEKGYSILEEKYTWNNTGKLIKKHIVSALGNFEKSV